MTDTVLAAVISCVSSLIGVFATLKVNARIERNKRKDEIRLKIYQEKRERLNEVYEKLICIIYLYPSESPNDVLKHIEYTPNYSMESFDSIIRSIDIQIEDYKKQLENTKFEYEEKCGVEGEIHNREYAKAKIIEIRDKYYEAREEYYLFSKSRKMILDLYAGQKVRDCLVEFEVAIYNTFISGQSTKNEDGSLESTIERCRKNLIDTIREDIGTF